MTHISIYIRHDSFILGGEQEGGLYVCGGEGSIKNRMRKRTREDSVWQRSWERETEVKRERDRECVRDRERERLREERKDRWRKKREGCVGGGGIH